MSACADVCVFSMKKRRSRQASCFLTPVQLLEMQWTELFYRMTHTHVHAHTNRKG